jgi:glycosyltransferase involved in cell wall biosynthesis
MFLASPSGGFKVVYEYANRLQARGAQVAVVHPRNIAPQNNVLESAKALAWRGKLKFRHRPLVSWFPVHPDVDLQLVPDLRADFIPDADAVFATAYDTAHAVARLPESKGRKFYLLQAYEDWNGPEECVRETWRLPMHKIVISRWLYRIAEQLGEAARADYIPIGMDLGAFEIATPIEARQTPRVGMLAHPNENKGLRDGLAAIEIARKQIPQLQAILFGTEPRESMNLPEYVEYEQCPAQARLAALYNSCQVFLNPSWSEGWGLTSAEAMACGCALVSARNGGVDEFAMDEESALLVPIKSPDELAARMLRLLLDAELRHRIARAGRDRVRHFTWDRAVDAMEKVLNEENAPFCS